MKKLSFILAIASAITFTLTACGEKAQTPEEMKLAARQDREKALEELRQNGHNGKQLTIEQMDSLVKIINKGKNEDEYEMIIIKEERKFGEPAPLLKRKQNDNIK